MLHLLTILVSTLKSMIVEKFCRAYKARIERRRLWADKFYDLGEQDYLIEMPIASIQMSPFPDARRFYLAILEKFKLACFPGSSGSPILIYSSGTYHDKPSNTFKIGNRIISLGLLFGGPIYTSEGKIEIKEIPARKSK